MSLPLAAVDRLFDRLIATYGRDFLSRYEGVDIGAVKTSWAHELAGFSDRLGLVAWALENLPDRAPNVIEFRALCRRAPVADPPRIDPPPANPERVAAELAKLGGIRKRAAVDRIDWARAIVNRHQAGDRVDPLPLKMAQSALARSSCANN